MRLGPLYFLKEHHNIKTANTSLENVTKFKYVQVAVTHQNYSYKRN